MNLGAAIKILRRKSLMSQSDFAEAIGITQPYLSLIEKNRKKPSLEVLEKISNSLKTPLPILFWFSVGRDDVPEDRQYIFDTLKPSIDKLVDEVFN